MVSLTCFLLILMLFLKNTRNFTNLNRKKNLTRPEKKIQSPPELNQNKNKNKKHLPPHNLPQKRRKTSQQENSIQAEEQRASVLSSSSAGETGSIPKQAFDFQWRKKREKTSLARLLHTNFVLNTHLLSSCSKNPRNSGSRVDGGRVYFLFVLMDSQSTWRSI